MQSELAPHVRWASGGAPVAPTATRSLAPVAQGHVTAVVPVALAETTARAWGVEVGDELVLTPEAGDLTPLAVVVSGTFTPVDPEDGFWQVEPRMTGIAAIPTPQGGVIPQGALVAAAGSYGAVTDGMWRAPSVLPEWPESPVLGATWRYPFDDDRLVAGDAAALRRVLVRLDTDSRLGEVTGRPLQVTTGIGGILSGYEGSVLSTRVVTAFATAGLTALAVLVLALAAVVAVARRQGEVRLVRARGGSLGQVLGQVVTGTALPTLPVAAAAVLVTVVLLPGSMGVGTWVEVALVVLVPVVASAVAVGWRVRSLERDDSVEEAVRGRRVVRTARRLVLELVVIALAVSAVTTVRSRGDVIAAGRTDWFATVTPVFVATSRPRRPPVPAVAGRVRREVGRATPRPRRLPRPDAGRPHRGLGDPAIPALVVGTTLVALLASPTRSTTSATSRRTAPWARRPESTPCGSTPRTSSRSPPDPVSTRGARPRRRRGRPRDGTGSPRHRPRDRPGHPRGLLRGTPLAVPTADGRATAPSWWSSGRRPHGQTLELVVRGTPIPVRRRPRPRAGPARPARAFPAVVVPLDGLPALRPRPANTVLLDAAPLPPRRAGAAGPVDRSRSGRVPGVDTVAAGESRSPTGRCRGSSRRPTSSVRSSPVLTLLAVLLLLATTPARPAPLVIRLRTLGLPHGGERRLAWAEVMPLLVVIGVLAGVAVGVLAAVVVWPRSTSRRSPGPQPACPLEPAAVVRSARGGRRSSSSERLALLTRCRVGPTR